MSKPIQVAEADGRSLAASRSVGTGDILLAVARQDRQRAEIQAKLNTMLDSLRSTIAVAGAPTPRLAAVAPTRLSSEPAAEIRARAAELFALDGAGAVLPRTRRDTGLAGSAAALKAKLDTLLEIENAIAFRAELRREVPEQQPVEPAAKQDAAEIAPSSEVEAVPPAPVPEVVAEVAAAPAPVLTPAWQDEMARLTARLDRMEAASVIAATTLDSLVSNFDAGQHNTFAAAQAAAREEVRSVISVEVQPALVELRGASSLAQEEIHGVLSLLGTCLERVVGHLRKIEGLPAAEPEAPLPFVPAPVPHEEPRPADVPPSLVASSGPAVPLPSFGRKSKLAALIDFGFGSRAA